MATTTYDSATQAIRAHLGTNWVDTPIAWPNADFETPTDGSPWVRLSIRPADATQADLAPAGQRRVRHSGLVYVDVFVRQGTGDGRAWELADMAAALFRMRTVGGIQFRVPHVVEIGTDEHGWYGVSMRAPMYRDGQF